MVSYTVLFLSALALVGVGVGMFIMFRVAPQAYLKPGDEGCAKVGGSRIVGGHNANISDLPYQVSLQSYGSHVCGGAIISNTRVVTAAQCTDGQTASGLSVRVESTNRGSGGKVLKVASICQHPQYYSRELDYDVSVLRLDGVIDVVAPAIARPICFDDTYEPVVGKLATVSGWGTLSSGSDSLPLILQRVDVPIVDHNMCVEQYSGSNPIWVTDNMLCAGFPQGGKDACQGDSGGPLVMDNRLVGISSWGKDCGEAKYSGVYANVKSPSIYDHIRSC